MPIVEMPVFVVYDVEDDKIRSRLFNACLDYDLKSVQYSAFCGRLWRGKIRELVARLHRELGDAAGHVLIIPMRTREWRRTKVLGSPIGPSQVPMSFFA